jgi:acetolactate synthase-1/2/3 large subunit
MDNRSQAESKGERMSKKAGIGRGRFLAASGALGAAGLAAPVLAQPAASGTAGGAGIESVSRPAILRHAAIDVAQVSNETVTVPGRDPDHIAQPGSDFMVDCIKKLGYEYVAAIPGSTFRGFQESVINYDPGRPEWITTVHEEISTAMAHGYAKASGKPMVTAVHGMVGLQHASMAIYNAYADRVPMLVVTANYADATHRSGAAEWAHNAVDMAAMVRGFVKYDDQPASLQHFAESLARAHGLAMTPPYGPVLLVLDQDLQENPMGAERPLMRPFTAVHPPAADANAIAEIAKMLVAAESPVIVVERTAHSQNGVDLLVALAEALQAPVIDRLGRMNFPTNHHLWQQLPVISTADVVLALDVGDLFSVVGDVPDTPYRRSILRIKPGTKVISIDAELNVPGGNYQDKQRYFQPDYAAAGDAEATLPALIEAVKRAMPDARRAQNSDREDRYRRMFLARRQSDLEGAAVGWDASPVSVPRLVMEVWNQIRGLDWALVSPANFQGAWQQRLWDFTKHHQYIGGWGAAGVGYGSSAAVGAALAHRNDGVISININGDGDYLMSPGSHWTAAHHRLPLLTIIHNNRAWHQEMMFIQNLTARRSRHPERGRIGTEIVDPNVDYAKIASGFGVYAQGPILSPADLGPAIARALAVVRKGEPALLDVITQGR